MFIKTAMAMAGGSGEGGQPDLIASLMPMVLIMGILYFLLIRPQQKTAKERREKMRQLAKGDKVVTTGGLHGEVTGLTDRVMTMEIAPKIRVKVDRSQFARHLSESEE